MRLSDFENEAALDLLAQLIDPATEIMNDQKIVQIVRSGRPTLFAVKEILANHKKAAMEIVAAMHGKNAEDVKFNVLTLASDVIELMNDPDVQAVFFSASQNVDENASGSAMASTEETEK